MIRLIATDMDGTLLNSASQVPEDLPQVIAALKEKGVLFCAASGRQYASLRRELEAVADQIVFICENGALIMKNEERLFLDAIDPALLQQVIAKSRPMEKVYPVICRAGMAIIEKSSPDAFVQAMLAGYPNVLVVDDLAEHTHYDDVCKVAFYDEGDAQAYELPLRADCADGAAGCCARGGDGLRRLPERYADASERDPQLCDGKRPSAA